jgi:hypothetical protein
MECLEQCVEKKFSVLIKVDVRAADEEQAAAKAYQALLKETDAQHELSFIVVDSGFKQKRVRMTVSEAQDSPPTQSPGWEGALEEDDAPDLNSAN